MDARTHECTHIHQTVIVTTMSRTGSTKIRTVQQRVNPSGEKSDRFSIQPSNLTSLEASNDSLFVHRINQFSRASYQEILIPLIWLVLFLSRFLSLTVFLLKFRHMLFQPLHLFFFHFPLYLTFLLKTTLFKMTLT